jgi:hypothetical protein
MAGMLGIADCRDFKKRCAKADPWVIQVGSLGACAKFDNDVEKAIE